MRKSPFVDDIPLLLLVNSPHSMASPSSYQHQPSQVAATAFLARNATVLGDVTIGEESSIWYGAVVRGDTAPIRIGRQTNVQDLSCLHADDGFPCSIGDRVTIGHGAIVHGATVENDALIGMRAVVMNGAIIGAGSIVGVGAVVTEGARIPPGSIALGIPARVIRRVEPEDAERLRHAVEHYVGAAREAAQAQGQ